VDTRFFVLLRCSAERNFIRDRQDACPTLGKCAAADLLNELSFELVESIEAFDCIATVKHPDNPYPLQRETLACSSGAYSTSIKLTGPSTPALFRVRISSRLRPG
jgi:hypothetical protein